LLRRVLDGLHSQGEEVTVDSFRSAVLAMRLERLRRDLKRIS
jgi:hypothetical protein